MAFIVQKELSEYLSNSGLLPLVLLPSPLHLLKFHLLSLLEPMGNFASLFVDLLELEYLHLQIFDGIIFLATDPLEVLNSKLFLLEISVQLGRLLVEHLLCLKVALLLLEASDLFLKLSPL
jgi:hypothetical protein